MRERTEMISNEEHINDGSENQENGGEEILDTIILGDCREIFPIIKEKLDISLITFDPPYNIGYNYDKYDDNIPPEEYVKLLSLFRGDIPVAVSHYPEEMMKYVCPALGYPVEVLSWIYNSNIRKRFRLINIYGKEPNFSAVRQPYKNPKDARIAKLIDEDSNAGSEMYDWFYADIVKNVTKGKNSHPCPLPVKVMEIIVRLLTEPGDIVYDPFMGSGSTAIACLESGRHFIGSEISEKYADIANQRIQEFRFKQKKKIF